MVQPISYDAAWLALYSLRTPSITMASSTLLEMSAALKVSSAIAQAYPKDFKKRLRPLKTAFEEMRFPKKEGDPSQASIIVSQLIDKHLCPLDEVWLDEEAMNYSDDFTLPIAVQGLKMSMEDFGDWASGDPAEVADHLGLQIMLGLLWGWFDNESEAQELWRTFNERFKWGVPDFPKIPNDHYVNVKRLRRKLRKAGAHCLCTLLLAIDGSTDNVFFDFDYEYWQAIELSVDSLLSLHRDWQKALPLLEECNQAFDLLAEEPEFYKVFLDAYRSALRPRTKN
jgi:hypothetical protein